MGSDQDRKKRDFELLSKSHRALQAEQNGEVPPAKLPAPDPPYRRAADAAVEEPEPEDDDNVMMYRGRPVRQGSSGTPGAGSSTGKPKQFRGAGGGRGKKKSRSTDGDSLKAALAKLAELHAEGLITKSEFDSKRRQILDRL